MLEYSQISTQKVKSVAYRSINGQTIIVNLKNRTINILNSVASRIWELIDGNKTNQNIIQDICSQFDIDYQEAEMDCIDFLLQMKRNDLIDFPFVDNTKIREAGGDQRKLDDNVFEILREEAANKKIPIVGHFDLTYKCNVKCKHCYLVPKDRQELNTSEVKNVLNQLAEAGMLYLTLSGGEILLRDDLFEIASYARQLNFALRFLTNGILLDQDKINRMALFFPELVAISIYSVKPEIHDAITGMKGSFQKSISSARMLKEKGINLKISTVIMKQNVEDYGLIAELAKEFNAQFQADYRISPKTDGNKCPLSFHINDEKLRQVFLDPVLQKNTDNSEKDLLLEEDYQGVFNIIPCGAGHMSCYISPYGDIYPCVQLPVNCGNLRDRNFSDIWTNSAQMLAMRSVTISDLPICSKCDFFQYCRLCIGLNYVEEGSILIPSKRACKEANLRKELGQKRR